MSDFAHLHTHTEHSPLDGLQRAREMVAAAAADGQRAIAVTDHGSLGGTMALAKAADEFGVKAIGGCLLRGQEIYTSAGVKAVEDVEVGDLVLTHRGRFRPVVRTMTRRYEGRGFRMHLSGRYSRTLTLTEEHPILIRTRDGRVDWTKPGEIVAGRPGKREGASAWNSWVCLPKLEQKTYIIDMATVLLASDGWSFRPNAVKSYPRQHAPCEWPVPRMLEIDSDLAYLMGVYAAEGHLGVRQGEPNGRIGTTHHISEQFIVDRIARVANRFGAQLISRPRGGYRERTINAEFNCLPIALLLADTVKRGASSKTVPAGIMTAPLDVKRSFVRGLLDGDGRTVGLPSNTNNRADLRTTSPHLAWGLRALLADEGFFPHVGRKSRAPFQDIYQVPYNPLRSYAYGKHDESFSYRPVARVDEIRIEDDVFNFEVEEDNSYVSDFVLHNCEGYLAIGSRFERNTATAESGFEGSKVRRYHHLTILAASRAGWTNLVSLSNAAAETVWYQPRMDYDLLTQHGDGLILGTGCLGGPVIAAMLDNPDDALARGIAQTERLLACVDGDKDRLFVEVMDHGIPAQRAVMDNLTAIAAHFGLRMVATNDAHFTHQHQQADHDRLLAVGVNRPFDDPDRFRFTGSGYWLRTGVQMRSVFPGLIGGQDVVANSLAIAEQVEDTLSAFLPANRMRLPKFPVPAHIEQASQRRGDPSPQDTLLRGYVLQGGKDADGNVVIEGAKGRYGSPVPQHVMERIDFELGVIAGFGFADYFLIVAELARWARGRGFNLGAGRGSASGAVVSFCLGITDVDPIEHGLLFERFLDVTRKGMPDIDLDFPQELVGDVVAHLQEVWGEKHVAQIGTYGTKKAKSLVRDMTRLAGDPSLGERLSEAIPKINKGLAALLDPTNDDGVALRDLIASDPRAAAVIQECLPLEGVKASPGIHACGIVLCDEPLDDLVPMRVDSKTGARVTTWEAGELESVGFVKFDRLALKNLDVIAGCTAMIAQATGEVIDTRYGHLPMDSSTDPRAKAAWDLLAAGDTAGLFQISSSGMTKLVKGIAPQNLSELSDAVALYRPGPMGAGMHERYVARKRGDEPATYDYLTADPAEQAALASVLDRSMGLIVVQEHLMSLSRVVAGFGPGRRNRLRKAFSKKIEAEMQSLRQDFIAGGLVATVDDPDNDTEASIPFSRNTLDALWTTFAASASYIFNASHSTPYAYISYQTAFLKANWPAHYAAAQLSVTEKDTDRLPVLHGIRHSGVTVLGPDLLTGSIDTAAVDDRTIRIGLSEIAGVKDNAAALVAARDTQGPFTSLADVVARAKAADGRKLPINVIEALIDAGSLDGLGHPRMGMLAVVRTFGAATDEDGDTAASTEVPVPDIEFSTTERAERERARLGVVLGTHPLTAMQSQVREWNPTGDQSPCVPVQSLRPAANVVTKAVVSEWDERPGKGGTRANFTLEGSSGAISGVMWPNRLAIAAAASGGRHPVPGDIIAMRGRVKVVTMRQDDEASDGELDGDGTIEDPQVEMVGANFWLADFADPARDELPPWQALRRPIELAPRPTIADNTSTATLTAADTVLELDTETVDSTVALRRRMRLRFGRVVTREEMAAVSRLWSDMEPGEAIDLTTKGFDVPHEVRLIRV